MRPWRFNICYSTWQKKSSTASSITIGKLILHSASLLTHPGDGFTFNYALHVLELFERFWKEHLPGKTPIFIHILQYLASKTVVFCRFPANPLVQLGKCRPLYPSNGLASLHQSFRDFQVLLLLKWPRNSYGVGRGMSECGNKLLFAQPAGGESPSSTCSMDSEIGKSSVFWKGLPT